MSYEFYTVEKKAPIAWVYLDRPEKKNAMHPPAWIEPVEIFEDLNKDDSIRVVIVTSSSDNFCAGIDLMGMAPMVPEIMESDQKGGTKKALLKNILWMQAGINAFDNCQKPVIAAVSGHCIGAGLDMITACDIRLCTENAVFSLREAAVGIAADMGVLQRLPHIVGQGITRELAFTAKDFDAKRAREILLVNEIYADRDELLKEAELMATQIAENSPLAVQASKDVLNYGIGKSIDDGLKYVATMSTNIVPSEDLFEAMTAFAEKRKPVFKGR